MQGLSVRYAQSTRDVGPTAATLEEAFSELFGAGLGLLVGSACAAVLIRRGSGFVAGLVAGVAAYALAVVPYLVVTRSSDIGIGEALSIAAAFFPLFLAWFVVLGALIGSLVRTRRHGRTPVGNAAS